MLLIPPLPMLSFTLFFTFETCAFGEASKVKTHSSGGLRSLIFLFSLLFISLISSLLSSPLYTSPARALGLAWPPIMAIPQASNSIPGIATFLGSSISTSTSKFHL